MSIKPLHDNIILEPLENEKATKSGIFLPETSEKDRPEQGTVVAVGKGRVLDSGSLIEPLVKVGDKIIFKKYSSDEIKIDDKKYFVVSEKDILAIIN